MRTLIAIVVFMFMCEGSIKKNVEKKNEQVRRHTMILPAEKRRSRNFMLCIAGGSNECTTQYTTSNSDRGSGAFTSTETAEDKNSEKSHTSGNDWDTYAVRQEENCKIPHKANYTEDEPAKSAYQKILGKIIPQRKCVVESLSGDETNARKRRSLPNYVETTASSGVESEFAIQQINATPHTALEMPSEILRDKHIVESMEKEHTDKNTPLQTVIDPEKNKPYNQCSKQRAHKSDKPISIANDPYGVFRTMAPNHHGRLGIDKNTKAEISAALKLIISIVEQLENDNAANCHMFKLHRSKCREHLLAIATGSSSFLHSEPIVSFNNADISNFFSELLNEYTAWTWELIPMYRSLYNILQNLRKSQVELEKANKLLVVSMSNQITNEKVLSWKKPRQNIDRCISFVSQTHKRIQGDLSLYNMTEFAEVRALMDTYLGLLMDSWLFLFQIQQDNNRIGYEKFNDSIRNIMRFSQYLSYFNFLFLNKQNDLIAIDSFYREMKTLLWHIQYPTKSLSSHMNKKTTQKLIDQF